MYDTIIVGAGTAGCVLANRLSGDPARKVLLLEAGGDAPINSKVPSDWVTLFNTSADWAFSTVAQEGCRGRRIFWPRGKMIGGSGAMNAMIYIRGLPSDFDTWEKLGCAGWGWQDVLPDFIAAEHNADHGDSPWHGTGGPLHIQHADYQHPFEKAWVAAGVNAGFAANPDFNGESQEGFGNYQFFIKDGRRAGTSRMYLEPVLSRPNLTVVKNVHVTGLVIEQGRARAVRYLENGTPVIATAASGVVMSAGTLGTTQLLQLSGLGRATDLEAAGVRALLDIPELGYNLQDHINIPFSFYTKEEGGIGAWDDAFLAESFKEWEDHGTGPRATPWVAAGAHVRSRPDVEPDLQFYGAASPHRDYARFLSSRSGMTFHSVLQRPESRGTLRLRNANPLEAPDIDPRYFVSDESGSDLQTLVEAIRIQRRLAETEPLKSILAGEMQPSSDCQTDEEIAGYIRGHCTTLYHPAGTCRMGSDAGAVVDPATLALNGVDGLYVADASVFPRMISGNTNATTILIAERAARAILAA